MNSLVNGGDRNYAYLSINGDLLYKTWHETSSDVGWVSSTGGRVVTLEASAGDKIEVTANYMQGSYNNILYCVEYIPKM